MASQNLWRGLRTTVAVVFTAGLSVAALYAWFYHIRKVKNEKRREEADEDGESTQAVCDEDGQGKEERHQFEKDTKKVEQYSNKDLKNHRNIIKEEEELEVVLPSGDDKPARVKPTVPSELPDLEITTKVVNDPNNTSQPEEKSSTNIPLKSLRIDSADKKRVLVLGLDKAGKSTFVLALCGRPVQAEYNPTQGFAVVTTTIGNKALNFWEVGGALKLRQHWDHYIDGTQVLVYIIDSSSLDTVNVAKVELLSLVEANKHLETIPWLIIASKQDLPGAMNPEELRESLNIPQVPEKPEKIVIGMELPAKGLKKGISNVKNFFTFTDF